MELRELIGPHPGPVVLSLCDLTGNMVKPWAEAGYTCIIVDLQHPAGAHRGEDGIIRVGANLLYWFPPMDVAYEIVFAFPPCTNLSVSGARWFRSKGLRGLIEALELVERCRVICEASGAPYLVENPVSTLATYWRAPDERFDPCEYGGYLDPEGDAYTKRTCLWVGAGFEMPEKRPVDPSEGSKMHLLPPSAERANLRSATPLGFARAVFTANREVIW